jgi:hypothetical protein
VRRSGAANDRRKRTRLRFFPSVRDERALHGCKRALVADVEPTGFCFLGWQICFVVALWSPRRATPALRAKESLTRCCAVLVTVIGRMADALPIPLERMPVVRPWASLDDAASLPWLRPAPRGNSGQWSGVRLQRRRCRAKWCVSFYTTPASFAVRQCTLSLLPARGIFWARAAHNC